MSFSKNAFQNIFLELKNNLIELKSSENRLIFYFCF